MTQIADVLDRTEKIVIEDTNLAAALLTVGCQPYEACPSQPMEVRQRDGSIQRRRRFKFNPSPDAKRYVSAWTDRDRWNAFEKENPEHPLCYIRWAFYNKDRYLDAIKQSAILVVKPHPTMPDSYILRKKEPNHNGTH
jgi:hypothetical protein